MRLKPSSRNLCFSILIQNKSSNKWVKLFVQIHWFFWDFHILIKWKHRRVLSQKSSRHQWYYNVTGKRNTFYPSSPLRHTRGWLIDKRSFSYLKLYLSTCFYFPHYCNSMFLIYLGISPPWTAQGLKCKPLLNPCGLIQPELNSKQLLFSGD